MYIFLIQIQTSRSSCNRVSIIICSKQTKFVQTRVLMFSARKDAKTIIQQSLSNRNEPRANRRAISNCSSVHCSSTRVYSTFHNYFKDFVPICLSKETKETVDRRETFRWGQRTLSTYFHTLTSQTNERLKFQFNEN